MNEDNGAPNIIEAMRRVASDEARDAGVAAIERTFSRPNAATAMVLSQLPRSEARADAIMAVSKTMERAGKGQHWGPMEADTAYAIAELLLKLRE